MEKERTSTFIDGTANRRFHGEGRQCSESSPGRRTSLPASMHRGFRVVEASNSADVVLEGGDGVIDRGTAAPAVLQEPGGLERRPAVYRADECPPHARGGVRRRCHRRVKSRSAPTSHDFATVSDADDLAHLHGIFIKTSREGST
jgi:hypothetical protein